MTGSRLATAVKPPSMEIRVAERDDAPTLENMLNLYLHDLSPFTGASIGEDGRFAYPRLPQYWTAQGNDEGRVPYIILAGGEMAGFALKSSHSCLGRSAPVSNVSEFFVLRRWRGLGIGTMAARALFDRFAGQWEVAQLRANRDARAFWLRVIDDYLDDTLLCLGLSGRAATEDDVLARGERLVMGTRAMQEVNADVMCPDLAPH